MIIFLVTILITVGLQCPTAQAKSQCRPHHGTNPNFGRVFVYDNYNSLKQTHYRLEHIKSNAMKFDPVALTQLGLLLYQGKFGAFTAEKDVDKARVYLEQAAAQGYAPAMVTLGDMYAKGCLGLPNKRKALELYVLSSRYGYSPGQFKAGSVISAIEDDQFNNPGDREKLLLAKMYLTMASKDKTGGLSRQAMGNARRLGNDLETGILSPPDRHALHRLDRWNIHAHDDKWIPNDFALSYYDHLWDEGGKIYLQHRMMTGDAAGIFRLGNISYHGYGWNEQNYEEAEKLFRIAAIKGYAPAYYMLGKMYRNGEWLDQNDKMGYRLMGKAARRGVPAAMVDYAIMSVEGQGKPKNYKIAYYYLTMAQDLGWFHGDLKRSTQTMLDLLTREVNPRQQAKIQKIVQKKLKRGFCF